MRCGAFSRGARAESRVFSSSMAMVIGPTPPGTGVMAAGPLGGRRELHVAHQLAARAVRLVPTSMTIAPSLIQPPRMASGLPSAATTTSAPAHLGGEVAGARVADRDGGVGRRQQQGHRLADDVRAAHHHRPGARSARRRPRPAASSRRWACRRRSAAGPPPGVRGCRGGSRRRPCSGRRSAATGGCRRVPGSGSWTRMPSTSGSAFRVRTSSNRAASDVSAGRW